MKKYFIALTINEDRRCYEVSREEQQWLKAKFPETTDIVNEEDGKYVFYTIKAEARKQYETMQKLGTNVPIPDKIRKMLHRYFDFPLAELHSSYYMLHNRIIAVHPGRITIEELVGRGAKPYTPLAGESIYAHPDDETPYGTRGTI